MSVKGRGFLSLSLTLLLTLLLNLSFTVFSEQEPEGSTEGVFSQVDLFLSGPFVQIFMNGGNNTGDEPYGFVDITPFKESGDFHAFLIEVESQLPVVTEVCDLSEENHCRPEGLKIYNWQRKRIRTTNDLVQGDLLYVVMWNESFIWPGLYIGHKVTVGTPIIYLNGTSGVHFVTLETVTLTPRAFVMEEFLTDDECHMVRELGQAQLKSSTVGLEATLATSQRNSKTAWLRGGEHVMTDQLGARASFVTNTPILHQEGLQLLHYEGGGFYNSHCDYFGDHSCAHNAAVKNRFVTLLFYLNDVEEGGGTAFTRTRGANDTDDPWTRDVTNNKCMTGYVSMPKKRKALMFYDIHPTRYRTAPLGDKMSEHIACNVTKGEKWAANFWIWNNRRFGEDPENLYQAVHEGAWWETEVHVNSPDVELQTNQQDQQEQEQEQEQQLHELEQHVSS